MNTYCFTNMFLCLYKFIYLCKFVFITNIYNYAQ